MSAIYRTLKNCNKKMGSPSSFSPCVTVILSVFSKLWAKCSKLKQPSKILNIAKTMNLTKTLSPFVCLGYIFAVKRPQITWSWKNCGEIDRFIMISYLSVALKASISKRTSTIQIFSIINMYFCVAIASKNAIKGGREGGLRSRFIPKRPKKGQFRLQMIILRE